MGFGPSAGKDEKVDAIGGAAASHWAAYADEMEAEMNDGDVGEADEQTDFQRMEAAAAKNQDGVNPFLLVVVVIAAGIAAYTVFVPPAGPSAGVVITDDGVRVLGNWPKDLDSAMIEFSTSPVTV